MGVVVLASGGMDSALLLQRAADRLAGVVFCQYGQPAALQEWRALQAQLAHLGWVGKVHEVHLTTMCARGMQAAGDTGPRVVPGRNLIMLAHALNYAVSVGAESVWYGPTDEDQADYPDCRPHFLRALNAADSTLPLVVAPLIYATKSEIAEQLDPDLLRLSWSCYEGGLEPCGVCASCRVRTQAL